MDRRVYCSLLIAGLVFAPADIALVMLVLAASIIAYRMPRRRWWLGGVLALGVTAFSSVRASRPNISSRAWPPFLGCSVCIIGAGKAPAR
ncbi:MAG: hypothetical protein IPI11_12840 [Haliscomenobacter sp.]|nr:hypothetical protein [Haliscomenobacter sp.]